MEKYLATDLDGTLLYPKLKSRYVSKENASTLKTFGKNIIIVSGRNQIFIKKICKELGLEETYIACNGAIISYKGKQIFIDYLDKNTINEIIAYVKKTYSDYTIILFDSNGKLYSLSSDINEAEQKEKKRIKENPKTAYTTIKDKKKILSLLENNEVFIKMNIVLSEIDKLDFYNYLKTKQYNLTYIICKGSLETTSKNIDKGKSLKRLTEYMKINDEDIYVIGDDKNDLSMFKEYPNSFLIDHNNNKELHQYVKHVLKHFKDIKDYIKEE